MRTFNYYKKDKFGNRYGNCHFVVPVELCRYVLKKKFTKPFQLYLCLKHYCSGKTSLIKEDLEEIADLTGYKSIRSVRNNLKKLLKINWIGYNQKSGNYFIRSFGKIKRMCGIESQTGMCYDFDDEGFKNVKRFCIEAVIGYLINTQKKKRWMSEREKGRSKHDTHTSSGFFPISSIALAKILYISLSTAHKYKTIAVGAGYIEKRSCWTDTGISVKEYALMRKNDAVPDCRTRFIDGSLHLQDVDHFRHCLPFKRRREKKRNIKKRVEYR